MENRATPLSEINTRPHAQLTFGEPVLKTMPSTNTTPMSLYSHKEGTYITKNIADKKINKPEKIEQLIKDFSEDYQPIEVFYQDEILQTIYYGNSPIINKIKYYPITLILIMVLFFAAIYLFYRTSRSSEQNKLWAGMAKETAHQIGTPLSSLVGWTEILKTENVNPEYIIEMEKDVDRLQTITERFSKIGSKPSLQKYDLVAETQAAFDYLKRRSSKLIDFKLTINNSPLYVDLNQQLYGWTIENLVRNGIDAMKGKGTITITISSNSKFALVRITDTGKGINKRNFNKIFNPGFTTKKRGWGLGLSLARRIIETYLKGKIKVLKSNPEEGTTMEIALRLTED
jgi:signal transduction histidine kinase